MLYPLKRSIEKISAKDEELINVKRVVETGNFNNCKHYQIVAGELCVTEQLQ